MRRAVFLALLAGVAPGCIRRRPVPPPPPQLVRAPEPPPGSGSLWRAERSNNYQFRDVRAHFPGDLLTVVVAENAQGTKDANTDTRAESSLSASVQDFFGIPAAAAKFLPNGFDNEAIMTAAAAREFKGEATTDRKDTLSASITVKVVSVDPAGNLYVRGDKEVGVNKENQYITLSGLVRPEDIASDNTVLSTRVADARIEYYGRGSVGDKQRVPLVHRLVDAVWPF